MGKHHSWPSLNHTAAPPGESGGLEQWVTLCCEGWRTPSANRTCCLGFLLAVGLDPTCCKDTAKARPSFSHNSQLLVHMSTNDTALSVKQHLGYVELLYGLGNGLGQSLHVRIRREVTEGDTLVGACYRPLDQDKEVD